MRALQRTTLRIVLILAPLTPLGCVSWPHQVARSRASEQRQLKMNTAQLEESRGHLDVAKRLYEELRQQDPSNPECLHRLAVVYTRLNQHNAAEVYFRQANALRPNDPEILADMGYAAFVCKKYSESEALLDQSVKLRDGDRRAITNLAIVLAWEGKDNESLAAFQRVISESEAMRNLAAIQVARGDKDVARKGHQPAELAGNNRTASSNAISQAAASDAAGQRVIDVPPPPSSEAQPIAETNAPLPPLPPLPVISPNRPEVINATPYQAVAAAVAMPVATNCTSTAPPVVPSDPREPAPIPPVPPAEILPAEPSLPESPAKDDYSTSVPPSPKVTPTTTVANEFGVETHLETPVVFEPVVGRESESASEPLPVEPPLPINPPTKVEVKHSNVWRKTEHSHGEKSDDVPVPLKDMNIQKETSNAGRENSNVWNICLVTLLEEKRLVSTRAEFSMEYQSQQYRFSSAEALKKFQAAPHLYAPVAGGLDVVAVRNERSVAQGSLNFALWYHRQLYLFSTSEHAEEFRRQPHQYIAGN